ncbi:MAG: nuclear transport factor 2 family protein [Bacteroidota bacterium]
MTTQEIANRLVELCKTGQYETAYKELFASNAVAIEPDHAPEPQQVQGVDNLIAKGKGFQSMIEKVHSEYISEPVIGGNFFSVAMGMDITMKEGGRMSMDEVCVYKVENGKIVQEQFFF